MDFLNLHTHNYTNAPDIVAIVNQFPSEFNAEIPTYSIGVHPWKINEEHLETEFAIIKGKLDLQNCFALGECGLDKRIETPFDLQVSVFEKQLKLAQQYNKPVIIHCVAAFAEVMELKAKHKISVPMIIHGFSKSIELAQRLLEKGFYISFGKYLLRNPELETVFQSIPDNRFFLETDTIDEGIREVYALAAKYRNISLEELKGMINRNFETVFNGK